MNTTSDVQTTSLNILLNKAIGRPMEKSLQVFVTGHLNFGLHELPTQTWLRPVTTCVCRTEAADTIRAPDDERYAARSMLSLQWTVY